MMSEVNESRVAGTPEPQQENGGGVKGWITGVFMDPTATFRAIAESVTRPHPTEPGRTKDMSKWWLPILITIVIAIAVTLYTAPAFIAPMQADMVREAVMERGGSEADAQQAIAMAGAFLLPGAIIGIVIWTAIVLFGGAGVTHLVLKIAGSKGLYRHSRAVVAWSMLIATLGTLVKLPLQIVRKQMVVEMGPSLFFRDLGPSDRLFGFLQGFDIFMIWWMIVLLVGLAVSYRTSKMKAGVAMAALWVLMLLLMTFGQGGMGAGM